MTIFYTVLNNVFLTEQDARKYIKAHPYISSNRDLIKHVHFHRRNDLIYLASPYTQKEGEADGIEEDRYRSVEAQTAKMLKLGFIVFSPIVYGHNMAIRHNMKRDFQTWQKFNNEMITRSQELWIYSIDGWKTSAGVQSEIKYADYVGIKIRTILDNG